MNLRLGLSDNRSSAEQRAAVFLGLTLTLILFYYRFTVSANWIYSPDVFVLRSVLDIYPFTSLGEALLDNSVAIWVINILREDSASYVFLHSFYWAAFLLKWFVLYRLYGPTVSLTIIILFFFSFDLNQARLSASMSFLLIGYALVQRRQVFSIIFFTLGFMTHIPFAISLFSFLFLQKIPIRLVFAFLFCMCFAIYFFFGLIEESPAGRFIGYFEPMEGAEMTKFFLVTLALLFLYRNNLDRRHIIGLIGLIGISVWTGLIGLINISGRTSELAAINIILIGNLPSTHLRRIDSSQLRMSALLALSLAILFFIYRFTQWVILGNVPPPANI